MTSRAAARLHSTVVCGIYLGEIAVHSCRKHPHRSGHCGTASKGLSACCRRVPCGGPIPMV